MLFERGPLAFIDATDVPRLPDLGPSFETLVAGRLAAVDGEEREMATPSSVLAGAQGEDIDGESAAYLVPATAEIELSLGTMSELDPGPAAGDAAATHDELGALAGFLPAEGQPWEGFHVPGEGTNHFEETEYVERGEVPPQPPPPLPPEPEK